MKKREQIISNYIKAYNSFNIADMMTDLDESVKFVNVSNGEINITISGLPAFKQQAEQASPIFSSRQQTVNSFKHDGDRTEVEITYHAVLAIDLPHGLKKGNELNLHGKSIFEFEGDKIIAITDIS
ncbi:nuclear transport factor 2 family protein [Mucilaginibacter sabulilitoris]|uniref:Nuclear transport factor 2 family protein n=1 Tax=Mucilaginibacter sabulilitoris TaxID=1173583 RepID=A0ABZ0TM52_9SPHI|nr:nuclear transport factor 2 family protein [Mucilaginibacter sabulilitoris]WPU94244.1 nuclear transport factor 2 family protein [Mucilaginibacter sabulilitoris]